MKFNIHLSESEVQWAIREAILKKFPESHGHFYANNIKLSGSVKFRKKSVRKDVMRYQATVEFWK